MAQINNYNDYNIPSWNLLVCRSGRTSGIHEMERGTRASSVNMFKLKMIISRILIVAVAVAAAAATVADER